MGGRFALLKFRKIDEIGDGTGMKQAWSHGYLSRVERGYFRYILVGAWILKVFRIGGGAGINFLGGYGCGYGGTIFHTHLAPPN